MVVGFEEIAKAYWEKFGLGRHSQLRGERIAAYVLIYIIYIVTSTIKSERSIGTILLLLELFFLNISYDVFSHLLKNDSMSAATDR